MIGSWSVELCGTGGIRVRTGLNDDLRKSRHVGARAAMQPTVGRGGYERRARQEQHQRALAGIAASAVNMPDGHHDLQKCEVHVRRATCTESSLATTIAASS